MSAVTNEVIKLCQVAKTGWEQTVKVEGKGTGRVLAKFISLSLEGEFSRTDWEGIKPSTDNLQLQNQCVTTMTAMLLSRLVPSEEGYSPTLSKDKRDELENTIKVIIGETKYKKEVSNDCSWQDDNCSIYYGGPESGSCKEGGKLNSIDVSNSGDVIIKISGRWRVTAKNVSRVSKYAFTSACKPNVSNVKYSCENETTKYVNNANEPFSQSDDCKRVMRDSNKKPFKDPTDLDTHYDVFTSDIKSKLEDAITDLLP